MEHSIPANVTSFQFHLVGDMTLKQFSYLAAGLGFAYFVFIFLFPLSPYLALPIIILSAVSGAAFAFVPILDRPLDHWALAFFKAVYSPTQGKWKSPFGKSSPAEQVFINRLQLYFTPAATPRLTRITPIQSPSTISRPSSGQAPLPAPQPQPAPSPHPQIQTQPPTPSHLPSSEELGKLVNMAKEVQILQTRIAQTEKQIESIKLEAQTQEVKTPAHAQKIEEASQNLKSLLSQTEDLYRQTSAIGTITPIHVQNPKVVVIAPVKPQKTQLLLTSFPNVVNGIVTDFQGGYLDGVIVIIHNKEGVPVRALKTNKLGQFTGATPLPAGVYNLTLEKEGLHFDTLQVTLNDEIMPPLKIQPKKGGE